MNDEQIAREFVIRGVLRWAGGADFGENGAVLAESDFLHWLEDCGYEFEGSLGLPLPDQAADDYEAYGPA